jgi:outer membrane protein assembly factor BamB
MTRFVSTQRRVLAATLLLVAVAGAARAAAQSWPQWGGAGRNFVVDAKGLASTWPADGPRRLWTRSLGEGHSSIAVDSGRLYTQYRPLGLLSAVRRSEEEVVAALDAATGKTIWEHKYDAPTAGFNLEYGAGPHATPLIAGNRLFATGSNMQVMALDKQSGKLLWSHHLMNEYGAPKPGRGYSCSPIAYRTTIIVTAGGKGQSLMAFNQADGKLVWKNGSFDVAAASPILISVGGQDQLVIFGAREIVGVDPANGSTLWSHPHLDRTGRPTDWGLNISTPVWNPATSQLFVSAAYNTGSRLLHLSQAGGKTSVKELWFTNRMRVHIGTVIRVGDYYYGSSGDFGACPIVAADARTGEVLPQNRSFTRSTFLFADGKLIILDEDGTLGLAVPSTQGFKVLARASLLSNKAWTVPTLVGTRLFLRDRKTIMAVDLS